MVDPKCLQHLMKRFGPFVELERIPVAKRLPGGGFGIEGKPEAGSSNSVFFLDAFDQPVLYYRANPGTSDPFGNVHAGVLGTYNLQDNGGFTSNSAGNQTAEGNIGFDLGAGLDHPLGRWGPAGAGQPLSPGTFQYALHNPDVVAARRPRRPETYLLISAGPDALYGTADDVANFPANP